MTQAGRYFCRKLHLTLLMSSFKLQLILFFIFSIPYCCSADLCNGLCKQWYPQHVAKHEGFSQTVSNTFTIPLAYKQIIYVIRRFLRRENVLVRSHIHSWEKYSLCTQFLEKNPSNSAGTHIAGSTRWMCPRKYCICTRLELAPGLTSDGPQGSSIIY